jgi:hypothetical protein
MPVIRTSPRAFILALFPLAVLQAMLTANGIAPTAGKGLLPIPDWALIVVVGRLVIDCTLFCLGHLWLRAMRLHGRAVYGVLGCFAAMIGYMIAYRIGVMLSEPAPGTVLTAAILPVSVGTISGVLYAQFAGREFIDPDFVLEDVPAESEAVPIYDGPVQVRTSVAAAVIASAIPALAVSIPAVATLLAFLGGSGGEDSAGAMLALPAQMILATLFVMIVPSLIAVGATHALARAFARTRAIEYAIFGATTGVVGSLLLVTLVNGVGFIMMLGAVIGAIMGAVYRRFAGLEPLSLPEDVLTQDPETLVPEGHPSRKTRTVIING